MTRARLATTTATSALLALALAAPATAQRISATPTDRAAPPLSACSGHTAPGRGTTTDAGTPGAGFVIAVQHG